MTVVLPRFVRPWLTAGLAAAVLSTGCAGSPEVAAPTADQVIAAHIEAGLDRSVAECFVGIGSQELALVVLLPGAERTTSEAVLIEELTSSCEEASAFVRNEPLEPEALAFDDQPFTLGDDPILDRLWERCELGDGATCDQLWEQAPVGSEYERFGVTCGDREQIVDCSEELTDETVEEIDAEAEVKAAAKEARAEADVSS